MGIQAFIKAGFADLAAHRMPDVGVPADQAAAEKVLTQLLRATLTAVINVRTADLLSALHELETVWRYDGFGKVPPRTHRYVVGVTRIVTEHILDTAPGTLLGAGSSGEPVQLTRTPAVNSLWVAYRPTRRSLPSGETELVRMPADQRTGDRRVPATKFLWWDGYRPETYRHVARAFILILAVLDEVHRGVDSSAHALSGEDLEFVEAARTFMDSWANLPLPVPGEHR